MSRSEDDSDSSLNSSLESERYDDEEEVLAGVDDEADFTEENDSPIIVDDGGGDTVEAAAAAANDAPILVASQKKSADANNNKPSWKGVTLFPPQRKNSNPSKAWQFGGFRKENGKLNMENTVCGLCGKEFKYKNTPSHLSQHLQSEHATDYASKDDQSKVAQPKMSDFFVHKGATTK